MPQKKKTAYVKPEVLDLGPAATIHGALCSAGSAAIGNCTAGTGATSTCGGAGNSAGGNCLLPGNSNKTLV